MGREIGVAGGNYRKFLLPGDAPEAEFPVRPEKIKGVHEYCSIHGLWKN